MNNAITKYKEGTEEQKNFLIKVEKMNALFNREPEKQFVTDFKGQFNYLPISHIETRLDELFFGQWSTSNFKYQQICNEIIGDIELTVTHPLTGQKITRSGAASVVIMQDKGASLASFTDTKKKNALIMGFPKLKTECMKNAAQSIGKAFGRDLNRKILDSYENMIPVSSEESLIDSVIKRLDNYKGMDKDTLKGKCIEANHNNAFTEEFAREILTAIETGEACL
jgi:hypothetical protein